MTDRFEESGVYFGPFDANSSIQLETCEAYLSMKQKCKIAECVVLLRTRKDNTIEYIFEAKSSIPRDESLEHRAKFLDEIRSKFISSILVLDSLILQRIRTSTAFPETLHAHHSNGGEIRLVLVIPKAPDAALEGISTALREHCRSQLEPLGLNSDYVLVLNYDKATRVGLVSGWVSE